MAEETLVITLIGFFAGILTVVASLPQLAQVLKTRHVADLSMPMMVLFGSSAIVWTVYGLLIMSWPVIIVNILLFFEWASLIFLKVKFGKKH